MIDNYELFKDKLFRSSKNGETYYTLKILVRKKDFIASQVIDEYSDVFKSHNERLIYSGVFSNHKEFESQYALAKLLCNSIPYSRAYLDTNIRDTKKTMITLSNRLNKIMEKTIMSGKVESGTYKEISKLSKSVGSLKECSADRSLNWTLLDVDYTLVKPTAMIDELLVITFIDIMESAEIEFLVYNTPNGIHILLPNKDAHKFKNPHSPFYKDYIDFISNGFVECKENASALLYMK